MKKKFAAMALISVMALSMALTGCGSDEAKEASGDSGNKSTESGSTNEVTGYSFSYNGTEIGVDMDFAPILEALGEPLKYFEAESCAGQGIGKTYTYADFAIDTYPDGSKDMVLSITLKSDNVSTKEGIDLSMTKEKIQEKYGEPDETTDRSIGYKKNGMMLSFIFEGDSLVSIQYNSSLNL